jgi:hypothetical protein
MRATKINPCRDCVPLQCGPRQQNRQSRLSRNRGLTVLPTDSHMGPSSYAFRGISDLLMSIDLYEVRPRKDKRGVDLIFDALPFGRLWYAPNNFTLIVKRVPFQPIALSRWFVPAKAPGSIGEHLSRCASAIKIVHPSEVRLRSCSPMKKVIVNMILVAREYWQRRQSHERDGEFPNAEQGMMFLSH